MIKSCKILLFALLILTSPNFASEREHRIISLMPSQTELLFYMGFGENLVGVSDYCNFPPEVKNLPKIGGLELNLEQIVLLKPSVIVDLGGMHQKYAFFFQQVGIKYTDYRINSLDDIPSAAVSLAHDLRKPERGERFRKQWKETINGLSPMPQISPKVYVEIWDEPIQSAGPSSFIGEMIEKVGGKNIIPQDIQNYPIVNPEQIIKANPDFILIAYPIPDIEKIYERPGWSEISAIRRKNVIKLDYDIFVRPGPRCLEGMKMLSKIFSSME